MFLPTTNTFLPLAAPLTWHISTLGATQFIPAILPDPWKHSRRLPRCSITAHAPSPSTCSCIAATRHFFHLFNTISTLLLRGLRPIWQNMRADPFAAHRLNRPLLFFVTIIWTISPLQRCSLASCPTMSAAKKTQSSNSSWKSCFLIQSSVFWSWITTLLLYATFACSGARHSRT